MGRRPPYPSDTKYALSSSFPGSRTTPAAFSPIFFSTACEAVFPGVVMATMRPRRRWRRANRAKPTRHSIHLLHLIPRSRTG